MKLEKQRELVKACREVRIINQINGDRGQVCRGNILMETKSSGMKMNSEEVSEFFPYFRNGKLWQWKFSLSV